MRQEISLSTVGRWLNGNGVWLARLTSNKNRLVYMLSVIGLLTWLVAFIRMAYLSGPNWLVNDLGVVGAVLLLFAVIFAFSWKDSKD